ncbi:hypothetical protein HDU86_007532 [Geranomyces michiganensis]|nr:hypothetical protein HDU86_007532 [Geranomyces michiganensis]
MSASQLGKWKERTAETHETHIQQLSTPTAPTRFTTLLLGDSMLERFLTTGNKTRIAENTHVFNAGCGGDKVENVLYRLEHGLLDNLHAVDKVILHAGTNNLAGKKTLKMGAGYIPAYRAMMQIIRARYRDRDGPHLYITGLFDREGCEPAEIARVNALLEGLANEDEFAGACTYVQPFPTSLEDHVHMDATGYAKWDAALTPIMLGC